MAALMLLITSGFAQSTSTGIESKGLKLGFGFSYMSTSYDELAELFEYKAGFQGGGFLSYRMSPRFSLQPELLIVVKGTKQGGFLSLFDWASNYIEVPVLVKYHLADQSRFKPVFYAGPSFSYLLSSEIDILFFEPFDVTDGMHRLDLGLVLGAGLALKRLTFDVRYTFGMTNVIDSDYFNKLTEAEPDDFYYMTSDPDVKNGFLSFMLGFTF